MGKRTARRYRLRNAELDAQIEELVKNAQAEYGEELPRDFVTELIVTAIRLIKDHTPRGDVKLLNSAFKEMRHAFRVFEPFEHVRKVSVFGSARTPEDHPEWKMAYEFAERIRDAGWMVITGAGDGIMGAAQGGAGREQSFGVNIRLPFEQSANKTIKGDKKLVNFRYFFTRKVIFIKESHAVVLFPGGFGTHDEGFETLTLVQTGKAQLLPIIYLEPKGGSYWKDMDEYVREHLLARGMISEDDIHLYKVTDDADEAVHEILNFYSNYHSSRFVNGRLCVRVRQKPNAEQLDALNTNFADILTGGTIETGAALPEEQGECPEFDRVLLHYNRHATGRLRLLVNELNTYVTEKASSPEQAAPLEIPQSAMSPEAEDAEAADEG